MTSLMVLVYNSTICVGVPLAARRYLFFNYPERAFRGRIITAPLRRLLGRRFGIFRVPGTEILARMIWTGVAVAGSFAVIAVPGPPGLVASIVYAALEVAAVVDDIVTGDDDRWKRWRRAARNAVRWRPFKPSPVPVLAP